MNYKFIEYFDIFRLIKLAAEVIRNFLTNNNNH